MIAKFEIVQDANGQFRFRLVDADETVLLEGLPSTSKIGAQGDVLHARQSLQIGERMQPRTGHDGQQFLALVDKNGKVIANSKAMPDSGSLDQVVTRAQAIAGAPLVHTRVRARTA